MIPIRENLKKSGWYYRLIHREDDVAIFEQTKTGIKGTWYEVVVVQRHDGYEIGGQKMPAAEHLPSSEQWGKLGFTCLDKAAAFERAGELALR